MSSPAPQTPEQYLATVRALADRLTEVVEKAPTHSMALDALMLTFHAVAITHKCCTEDAGRRAMRIGASLVAESQAPAFGQSLH